MKDAIFCGGTPTRDDLIRVDAFKAFLVGDAPPEDTALLHLDAAGNPSHDLRRETEARDLLDAAGLTDAYELAVTNNPAAAAPYHGHQHALTVLLNIYQAARYATEALPVKALFTAALFHDADHTAGPGDDTVNIARALAWFDAHDHPYLTDSQRLTTRSLIEATAMPHRQPVTEAEAIIQDADVLQCTEPDGERFEAGLRAELGGFPTREQSLEFIRTLHLNTAWGWQRRNLFLARTTR